MLQSGFLVAVLVGLFLATVLLIPRHLYRKYLIYGLMLGGTADVLIIGLLSRVLHLFTWTNIGPANVWGWNALVPVTFTFWFMLYLYFLPVRTVYLVAYVLLFAGISLGMGQVTKNLGLYTYKSWYIYLMPVVFLVWFSVAAWVFRWQEKVIAERPVR